MLKIAEHSEPKEDHSPPKQIQLSTKSVQLWVVLNENGINHDYYTFSLPQPPPHTSLLRWLSELKK